jgi:NAD(P)-dependent dehydrogenase (short-subunit alcohol dehydrogenase family)
MKTKKISLVTGGGGMLGLQHASALLEMGNEVILVDVNNYSLKKNFSILNKKYSKKIFYYKVDISKEKDVKNLASKIKIKFKKINILINNAAIDYVPKSKVKLKKNKFSNNFEDFSYTRWNKELSVGLTGAFLMSKYFGQLMRKNEKNVIVNISSDLSVIAPNQKLYSHLKSFKPVTYSVIKFGIVGLTKYLAVYWAKKNIRVNSLSPGGIYNFQDKIFVNKLKKEIPLGRMAAVDEYKGSIKYLCSEESSYMTGHNLVVDGGRTVI